MNLDRGTSIFATWTIECSQPSMHMSSTTGSCNPIPERVRSRPSCAPGLRAGPAAPAAGRSRGPAASWARRARHDAGARAARTSRHRTVACPIKSVDAYVCRIDPDMLTRLSITHKKEKSYRAVPTRNLHTALPARTRVLLGAARSALRAMPHGPPARICAESPAGTSSEPYTQFTLVLLGEAHCLKHPKYIPKCIQKVPRCL